jgi:hypothetical protein
MQKFVFFRTPFGILLLLKKISISPLTRTKSIFPLIVFTQFLQ